MLVVAFELYPKRGLILHAAEHFLLLLADQGRTQFLSGDAGIRLLIGVLLVLWLSARPSLKMVSALPAALLNSGNDT